MNITVLTYLDSEDENSKDYDPVVPQVARTLRRRDAQAPRTPVVAELSASRLERRARIWLSAVLRNTKEDD